MSLELVEGERLAVAHACQEIGVLRFGVGHFGDLLHDVGNRALETLIHLAQRTFDVGDLALAFVALAFEDDLTAVVVGVYDLAPDAHGVGMLLRSVDLDLHGRGVVLAQQVLHGVHVVLSHIRESAAVVVPVAAERGVHAVFVVGFVGRRAEPHVVVQLFRDGLGLEVLLPHPEEFPGESRGSGDGHLEGPSQQAAVDEFLERFDRRAQSVEGVLEAEPGVQAEDASVLPDGLHHALALADGARHRLLAPDVLAGLGRLDGHDAVPVGRGGDVYDVDVGVGDQIPVVVIAFEGLVELLAAQRDGAFEVFAVDVADRHQAACIVGGEMIAALADAAHADDALRELVARGDEFGASEHAARHDGQQRQPACLFQKISAVTHSISGCVFFGCSQ